MKKTFTYILSLLVLFTIGAGSSDYLGPDRTRTTYVQQRKECYYTADTGGHGCHLYIYTTPDGSCPSAASTKDLFGANASCGAGWPGCTGTCNPVGPSESIVGCSAGEQGCRSTATTTTYPEANVTASILCSNPGSNGWCLGSASLEINSSEPVPGFNILTVEGTRNGATFACSGSTCSVPLLEGANNFSFWALSSWGDSSGMGTASGSVDTQPPFINGSLSGVAGNGGWFVSPVEVSASASDATSGVGSIVYSLDGGGQTGYSGPFSVGDGTHSIVFTATDYAGNSSSQTVGVNIDLSQPFLTIDPASGTPGANGWFVSSATVSASATDGGSGLGSLEYSIDGGASTAYSGPVSLGDGSHTVVFTATDQAGNSVSGSSTVNVDTQAPQLTLNGNTSYCPACGGTMAINYSVNDSASGVTVWTLMVDGSTLANGTSAETGTYDWDGSGLPAGAHTITLVARDLAGNLTQTEMSVTLTVPPSPEEPTSPPAVRRATATRTGSAPTSTSTKSGVGGSGAASTATGAGGGSSVPTATQTNAIVAFNNYPTPSGNNSTITNPSATTPLSTSNVLFGAAAAAVIGSTMAIVLDQKRKREEEEIQEAIAAARFNQAQVDIEKQRNIEAAIRAENLKKLEEAISDAESKGVSPEKAEEYRKLYKEGKIDELTKLMQADIQAAIKEKMPEYLAAAEHSPEAKKWLEENILKYSDDYQQQMKKYLAAQLPADYKGAMEHSPEAREWILDNSDVLLKKYLDEEAIRMAAYLSPEAKYAMEHSPDARKWILDHEDELIAQYQAQLAAIEQARKEKVASELGGYYQAAMEHSAEAKAWIVNNADDCMAQYQAELEMQQKIKEELEASAEAEKNKPWWEKGWDWFAQDVVQPVAQVGASIIQTTGDFISGAIYQYVMSNMDALAFLNPFPGKDRYFANRQALDSRMPNSLAFMLGRLLGDLLVIVQGFWEMASGVATASGGTIISCGTGILCISGGAAAIAIGAIAIGHGISVVLVGVVDAAKQISAISNFS